MTKVFCSTELASDDRVCRPCSASCWLPCAATAGCAPAPNVFVMHRGEHQVTVQMREAGGEWVRVLMERTGDLRAR